MSTNDWGVLDKILEDSSENVKEAVKSLFKETLASREREIVKRIEGARIAHLEDCISQSDGYGHLFRDCSQSCQANGYNKALTEVVALLQPVEDQSDEFHACPQDDSGLCDDCPCHHSDLPIEG